MDTPLPRRQAIGRALACAALAPGPQRAWAQASAARPDPSWYDAALAMKRLAESWGDQPYGAVLVLDGRIVGEGPSRVVISGDVTAHAEREALRDAQRRLATTRLPRSILVSTSRPCSACEAAAAEAGVWRMYHGAALLDAGTPTR